MASREGLTLKGLLHPRRPGKHGATMCTLQVQKQDTDYNVEDTESREQEQQEEEEVVFTRENRGGSAQHATRATPIRSSHRPHLHDFHE